MCPQDLRVLKERSVAAREKGQEGLQAEGAQEEASSQREHVCKGLVVLGEGSGRTGQRVPRERTRRGRGFTAFFLQQCSRTGCAFRGTKVGKGGAGAVAQR